MPPPDIGGIMDGVFLITIVSVVASLAVPLIVVGVVIWAIRRRRDPAEESLRERLARGEIDQAEFLVRMRALHDGDDSSIT
jgi:uncharacterized membrane protein